MRLTCLAVSCDRPVHSRGVCHLHYNMAWATFTTVPIVHGTTNGYGNRGCRCDDCKAANAAYQRDYRARTGRQ